MRICAYAAAAWARDGGAKKVGSRCGCCADCTRYNQAVQRAWRKPNGPVRGECGGLIKTEPMFMQPRLPVCTAKPLLPVRKQAGTRSSSRAAGGAMSHKRSFKHSMPPFHTRTRAGTRSKSPAVGASSLLPDGMRAAGMLLIDLTHDNFVEEVHKDGSVHIDLIDEEGEGEEEIEC